MKAWRTESSTRTWKKLIGWTGGSTHVRAFQIHKARQNAADLVGSIADPSNIDAVSSTRLFTAWFQQDFGKTGSIRVGQLAADDEIPDLHDGGRAD
jgi:porin